MSASTAAAALTSVHDPSATGLSVFVVCSAWVLALPAEPVERLLLPEEAQLEEYDSADFPAALGVLRVGRVAYAAWDLGVLLGLSPQEEAWILLRRPGAQGPLPLALRTGPCLSAAPLPASALGTLPSSLCPVRRGLFVGAFPTDRLGPAARRAGRIGLAVDLARLWSEEETALAEAALRAAGTGEA